MFEANPEREQLGQEFLRLSKPFLRHYVFSDARIAHILNPQPSSCCDSKIALFQNDTIKLMFSRNNWVSGDGAAKLAVM